MLTETSCSSCGEEFGPGLNHYSHCKDHEMKTYTKKITMYLHWVGYEIHPRLFICDMSSTKGYVLICTEEMVVSITTENLGRNPSND